MFNSGVIAFQTFCATFGSPCTIIIPIFSNIIAMTFYTMQNIGIIGTVSEKRDLAYIIKKRDKNGITFELL